MHKDYHNYHVLWTKDRCTSTDSLLNTVTVRLRAESMENRLKSDKPAPY